MKHGRIVWGGLLLVGAIAETYGILFPGNNDTFSEWTRWAFQTDTTIGRYAFLVTWGTFAAWFSWHIIGTPKNRGKK